MRIVDKAHLILKTISSDWKDGADHVCAKNYVAAAVGLTILALATPVLASGFAIPAESNILAASLSVTGALVMGGYVVDRLNSGYYAKRNASQFNL